MVAQHCINIRSMSRACWHGHHMGESQGDREGGIFQSGLVILSQIWPYNHKVITMCMEQTIGTVYQNILRRWETK